MTEFKQIIESNFDQMLKKEKISIKKKDSLQTNIFQECIKTLQ